MAFDAYDTNTSTGDDPAAFANVTKNRTDALRNHHLGTSAPATPVEGDIWIDNTSATRFIVKLYQNSAWVVLTDKIAEGDRDFDGNEVQNVHLEELATGSVPAASAGAESRAGWDSTLERVFALGSSKRHYLGQCEMDATTEMTIECSLNVTTLGPPAAADTNTELGGWLLDAAGKELNVVAKKPVPTGYTGADDLYLDLVVLLAAAETASDVIDVGGNWIAMTPGTDATSLAETTFTAVAPSIGSSTAQYSLFVVRLTIDYDGPASNVAAGDYIRATIARNGLTNIPGIIVTEAWVSVPVFNFDDSAT